MLFYTLLGSTTSSNSDQGDPQALHGGVCVQQQQPISNKDVFIAQEALELLVTCLELRSQLLCKY